MVNKTAISMVIPCYNSEKYIKEAIQSILDQTFENFELLIINDGSTDGTEQEIKKFKDSRIKYFKFQQNQGNCSARNKGMFEARGKYICMMDSDDISLPIRLKTQYDYLETHLNIGCVGSAYQIIDANGDIKRVVRRPKNDSIIKTCLLSSPYVQHSTMMFRNNLLKKYDIQYDESLAYVEDYDILSRFAQVSNLANISDVLVNYRNHFEQISTSKRLEQRRLANIVRKRNLESLINGFSEEELTLHLKLMQYDFIDDSELESCYQWLNRLIETNLEKKVYNPRHLYKFSNQVLQRAVFNNRLGGWAIEKEMLNYIRGVLPNGKSILEFGSGKGTEALLIDYKVTSIEHDGGFCYQRNEKHDIVHAPLNDTWYTGNLVEPVIEQKHDLIIIDGPTKELRSGLLHNIKLFKNVSAPILFDDVNREKDKEIMTEFCHSLNLRHEIIHGEKKDFAICKAA